MKNNFMMFIKNGEEILVNLNNVVKIEKHGDGIKVTYNNILEDNTLNGRVNYDYFDDDFVFIQELMKN